jgi:hypothetical protein
MGLSEAGELSMSTNDCYSVRAPASARRRPGFTLIEAVAMMTANALLITLAIVALAALERTNRNLSNHSEQQGQVGDLCQRLRADLWASNHAAWDEKSQRLKLTLIEGGAVEYRAAPGCWERRELSAKAVARAPAPLSLKVPAHFACTVSPAEAVAGTLVELNLTAPPRFGSPNDPGVVRQVVVQLGRDARLLQP